MTPPDRSGLALRAMRSAPAHDLLGALEQLLATQFGAGRVDLLLADYRLTVLLPVHHARDTPPATVDGSNPGRAFVTQELVQEATPEGSSLYFPVTVRGDRLGVLAVHFPAAPTTTDLQELAEVAELLGPTLAVAERDTDRYLRARRRERLTLAAEMQWQLLPGRACTRGRFAVAGQLEPAYSIGGDNFDWSTESDHVTVAVTNGTGHGITATLVTTLVVNALRNARRAGLGLAGQAALSDQALYAHHGGAQHVSTVLLRLDLNSGLVTAVDAGSPRILRIRGEDVTPVALEAQLPLGMFDGTVYVEQEFSIEPGDRLIMLSDGVVDAHSPAGAVFGESTLERTVRETRGLPASEAVRVMVRDLLRYHEGAELADDAVVVCLDWSGANDLS